MQGWGNGEVLLGTRNLGGKTKLDYYYLILFIGIIHSNIISQISFLLELGVF